MADHDVPEVDDPQRVGRRLRAREPRHGRGTAAGLLRGDPLEREGSARGAVPRPRPQARRGDRDPARVEERTHRRRGGALEQAEGRRRARELPLVGADPVDRGGLPAHVLRPRAQRGRLGRTALRGA